ncbi:hypothetical protein [Sphingobacterium siyangense]|uniref:hypothetical protein n=1 Tax=Sphingobacterium siyangense TaxID=459529 RepID=UPI00301B48D1
MGGIFINGRPNDEWNYCAGPWVKAQNTEINIETPLVIKKALASISPFHLNAFKQCVNMLLKSDQPESGSLTIKYDEFETNVL